MNWLGFWAAVIGSLAWPLSFLILGLLFRKPIFSLFERAHELGFGDWKVKISQDFDDAEEVAKELPPPPPETVEEAITQFRQRRFAELVAISPNAAILEEWREIETRLEAMGERMGLSIFDRRSPQKVTLALKDYPVFPSSLIVLINELREIRNKAAHTNSVSASDANRFRELSDQVVPFLQPSLLGQN